MVLISFDLTTFAGPAWSENILSSHGRDVFLISQLADEVEFNLGGRQVVLHKRIDSKYLNHRSYG